MKPDPGFDLERRIDAVERIQQLNSIDKLGRNKLGAIKIEQGINQTLVETILSLERHLDVSKRQGLLYEQAINELKLKLSESEVREAKLRESHAEADRELKELRARVLGLEVEKRSSGLVMEKLRRLKSEADVMLLRKDEILKELERRSSEKLLELDKEIDLLKRRGWLDNLILNELKTERSESAIREANLRESHAEAERRLEELRVRVSVYEGEKRAATLIIKELRREKAEAEGIAEESRQRSLKAREAAEVNVKRFGDMVPVAESLFKLLKMNVEDLVGMKDMLLRGEDETHKQSMTAPGQKRKRSAVTGIKSSPVTGAEMVRAFQEDDELCVEAVCTLYRQHVLDSESSEGCSKRRFYHFEKLWQRELVDYLIQADTELGVTRPVAEVKQRFPHVVNLCRQLAIQYSSYFIAIPGTPSSGQDEPRPFSLFLVCLRCYTLTVTDTHAMGACETSGAGEGEETSLDDTIDIPDH